jgi:hypothetical protein
MPNAVRRPYALLLGLLPLLLPLGVQSQSDRTESPLFADDAPLNLRLEGPFRTLSRNRRDREELDGILSYTDEAGREVTLDLRLRTRGNSRLSLCTYTPLRLNLRRRQVEGTLFAGQNHLKLVTLCKAQTAYHDYLALEYTVYRLFALLTERSYRVRWVEIDYVDTDQRRPTVETRSGFLIEDDSELAARTGMEVWRTDSLDLSDLDPLQTARIGLFQFLIGNTDWSAVTGQPGDRCCHNGDLFRDADGHAVVVPYDFDQSGLIDATYATPPENLPIRSVTQRLYRGYCIHNALVDTVIRNLVNSRSDIEALFETADLRDRTRGRVSRYIESFYEIVENPEALTERILDACRG